MVLYVTRSLLWLDYVTNSLLWLNVIQLVDVVVRYPVVYRDLTYVSWLM